MQKVVFIILALAIACSAVPLEVKEQTSRILGGNNAANLQFPFMASIQRYAVSQTASTRGHKCGGALITLQHVLTAASCLYEWLPNGPTPITTAEYRVFAGAHLLSNDTSADRVRLIQSYVAHPEYMARPAYLNDIGVIVLNAPFPNAVVTPIALPAATYNPRDELRCSVSGWGASSTTNTALANVEMKFASVYIYNQAMCATVYNVQSVYPNIHDTMVCAASYDIISSGCAGDQGNPLVCDGVLTGILAMHGNCAGSSFPEIYTRVNNYTTFIRGVTGSANTFAPGAFILLLLTLTQMAFASLLS